MNSHKKDELIEIFAGSAIDVAIVKSLLDDSEIDNFLKDENMGTIAPWQSSGGGAGAVKIIINSSNYESAKLIIEKFEQSKNNN